MEQRFFRDRLAEVVVKHKMSLRDILWIVQAYYEVKVLRRYRPAVNSRGDVFWSLPNTTICRVNALIELLGSTPEEVSHLSAMAAIFDTEFEAIA